MLLRKPTHAGGGSPTPSTSRFFTEIEGNVSSSSSISPPPVPVSPQSKTHAFFSSPFSMTPPSPPLPPKKPKIVEETGSSASIANKYVKDGERPAPPRSLTADFFSTKSSLSPPKPPPPPNRRNFLNLDLNQDIAHLSPLTLAGAFASTPTPTEIREEFISDESESTKSDSESGTLGQSNGPSSPEVLSEPTPKPPSLVFNPARAAAPSNPFDTLPSASSIASLGTEPDAEVLSTSPSPSLFSHLSLPVGGLGQPLSLSIYPSRPTSSHSFHASQAAQDMSATMTKVAPHESELSLLHPAAAEEELAPGMIIRSFLPSHRGADRKYANDHTHTSGVTHPPTGPSNISTNANTNTTAVSNSNTASPVPVPVTLRLNRPLGQGTFSSVWLAEDLSPTSLLLRSRKSLKDMKRKSTMDLKIKGRKESSLKAAGEGEADVEVEAGRGDGSGNGKLKSKSSLSSTSSLMRRLRGGVSGTRPGGLGASVVSLSVTQPSGGGGGMVVAMGRNGTLMPLPSPSSMATTFDAASPPGPGAGLPLPPSLIPGNRTSSSPSVVSSSTLGLALPANHHQHSGYSNHPIDVDTDERGQEIVLFGNANGSGSGYNSQSQSQPQSPPPPSIISLSPPMSPNFYGSDNLPVYGLGLGLDVVNDGGGSSVSRASSVSWKSSASASGSGSDDGHDGHYAGAEDGVQRNGSTRSTLSTRSDHGSSFGYGNSYEESVISRSSSTKSSVSVSAQKGRKRRDGSKIRTRLVAVKLTSRGVIEEREREKGLGRALGRREKMEAEERVRERDRTRVSFVREVEVLKHISHPNITPLLSHLTTRTHHLLVLPYLPGGDLLGLVNDDSKWGSLGESTLRRIFTELCKAVGWMHGVGLVHRDIKLENILLTVDLGPASAPPPTTTDGVLTEGMMTTSSPTSYSFTSSPSPSPSSSAFDPSIHSPPPSSSLSSFPSSTTNTTLPTPPQPLIKLTDFGLSRFIDPARPLLTTRCGSEAYAAPELVIGGGRAGVASSSAKSRWFREDREAGHDVSEGGGGAGGAGGYDARETDAWACGVVLYTLVARSLPFGEGPGEVLGAGKISGEGGEGRAFSPMERKQWLMRIARGEWYWPESEQELERDSSSSSIDAMGLELELRGPGLVRCAGAKRVVQKLLVRDPNRRERIKDLWDDEWVGGVVQDLMGGSHVGVEGLPLGSDAAAYSSFMPRLYEPGSGSGFDSSGAERLPSGLPESASSTSDSLSALGLGLGLGLASTAFSRGGTIPVFGFGAESNAKDGSGAGAFPSSSSTSSYEDDRDEPFDNDRRENGNGEDPESLTEDDIDDEEEDGEGWLVDKDGINNIARSEVPR